MAMLVACENSNSCKQWFVSFHHIAYLSKTEHAFIVVTVHTTWENSKLMFFITEHYSKRISRIRRWKKYCKVSLMVHMYLGCFDFTHAHIGVFLAPQNSVGPIEN